MAVDEIKRGIFPDEKELAADMEILVSTYLSPDSDTKVYVTNELRMSLERMISGEMIATQEEVIILSLNCTMSNNDNCYQSV